VNVPILAFEKICKRFGAVVVAHDIDLALSEGEAEPARAPCSGLQAEPCNPTPDA
jgi:hypothetical protein